MTTNLKGNNTQTQAHLWWSSDGITMIPVTIANPLPVNVAQGGGAGGTSSTFGVAYPGTGTAAGAEDPSGNMAALHVDNTGKLLIAGSFTGSSASVGLTGVTAPTSADEIGWIDGSGNLQAVSATNPLPITGTISASNPSVGTNSSASPASSTQIGIVSGGNLVPVSAANPIPVSGTVTAANASVSATGSAVPGSATYLGATVSGTLTGLVATANGLKTDGSAVTQPVSASSLPLPTGAATSAKQPAIGTAGTPSADVLSVQGTSGMTALKVDGSGVTQPISAAALPLPTGAATNSALVTINTTLGTPMQTTGGTVALVAGSAVIGHVINDAGSAIIGKVGIDQTTPGTTNAVSATNFPTTLDTNSGNKSASTIRVTLATDQVQLTNALKVDGSGVTQPVSAVSLPLPSGASTAVAQGSTTSGQSGTLVQGAVTTSSPTYSTTQTAPLSLDTTGALRVNVTAGSGGGGTASTFGSAFPATGTAAGFKDSTGTNMAAGNLDASGFLKVNVAAGGAGGGAVFGPTAVGSAAANPPVLMGGTANATATGVIQVQKVDSSGNAYTSTVLTAGSALAGKFGIDQTTVGTTNGVSLAQIGAVTVSTGNGTSTAGSQRVNISSDNTAVGTWGQGATGSAVPSGASYGGLIAKTANPSAASDGNLVGSMSDKLGRQAVVIGNVRDLKGNQVTTITSSTAETTIITAVASTFLDLYGITVENTSATATEIAFKDSTAGTTQFYLYLPAGDTRGFMLNSSDGYKQTTVNNNWTATCTTSVASIKISALYVKNI